MMHADFIEDDERFSDRETTDREIHLEKEADDIQQKIHEINTRVATATNLNEIYKAFKI